MVDGERLTQSNWSPENPAWCNQHGGLVVTEVKDVELAQAAPGVVSRFPFSSWGPHVI